ncbi:Phenylalanine--tRNA ligase beta subunit [Oligella ureolytica]|uniref:Phenylalanine--tRNA ligase beta subunit n=1 Tax=Oligella ureolytica TaxID=90244 RepID=A0A378XCH8_9BURK|nr:phenylalanine--tRNA ligase subunit beta [Oligella ureolytica]QPT40242.1 phenylalanine--tRNA ligase subunit beta [Oligella ureolytica]SUA50502.1 Phenylalanine--tRNA ligase beta subunit [Oligella ureolytica]
MFISESWLRSLINPELSTEELCHRLTMSGLEVEGVEPAAPAFTGVVVAEVKEIGLHPNADKLRICQVDDGSGELVQVVCGAPNAAAGIKVPMARVGAVLPGDFKIKKGKLRGELSLGMLCSADELGMEQDHDGLLILDESLAVGTDIRDALNLDDNIIEFKLTPNRADCLSVYGVGREVQALTGASLKTFDFTPVDVTLDETMPVRIDAPDLCGRFAGRIIRGVNAKAETPDYIKQRIAAAGMRPVSALVDISNYVMLELGRPTHVFDIKNIDTSKGLTVRWAKDGEKLKLLTDVEVELSGDTGVICHNDIPESMAGVMGGDATAVDLETTDIYLEAAFWFPEAVAGLTRKYKLSSEAAYRYERGVDFLNIVEHIEYMTRLILEVCGGQAAPVLDEVVNLPERKAVTMRLARCNKVLGVDVSAEEVKQIFTDLGFDFDVAEQVFTVKAPSYRFDIEIEEDLIEEVARVYGFERIPAREPIVEANIFPFPEKQRSEHAFRHLMAAMDYQEVVNYSFVDENWERNYQNNDNPIRLLNPIFSQYAVMRTSLVGGLLKNIAHNAKYRQNRVRVFELGRVFFDDPEVKSGDKTVKGINQPMHFAAASWGLAYPEQWGEKARQVDFFDLKNDLENLLGSQAADLRFVAEEHPALHPGRSAAIFYRDEKIGVIGELHPQWLGELDLTTAPVVFEIAIAPLMDHDLVSYKDISKQPVVKRDLALWVPSAINYQQVVDVLEEIRQQGILREITLFDIWKDQNSTQNERSLALRFILQDATATLEDAQVEEVMSKVLNTLVEKLGVRLR